MYLQGEASGNGERHPGSDNQDILVSSYFYMLLISVLRTLGRHLQDGITYPAPTCTLHWPFVAVAGRNECLVEVWVVGLSSMFSVTGWAATTNRAKALMLTVPDKSVSPRCCWLICTNKLRPKYQ